MNEIKNERKKRGKNFLVSKKEGGEIMKEKGIKNKEDQI